MQTWSILAVFIPFAIIGAWLAVPGAITDRLLQPPAGKPLPIVISLNEKFDYTATIRSNSDRSQYQLEIIQKKAATTPSSLIYQAGGGGNELIGRVETTGTYYFSLKPDSTAPFRFILYDIIHKKLIDSISFKNTPRS